MIRVAFEYIDHQLKENADANNCGMKAIRCAVRCCLCCLNKCLRFISKNAYIHTAVRGDGFCFAAFRSYKLIFNHLLAFGATSSITSILMIMGKIMVCFASMLVGYGWVAYTSSFNDPVSPTYVTSSLFISIAVLMMAYLVAEAFFGVFHIAIDTIMLSYCMDLDTPPVGKASRGVMDDHVKKLGKKGDTNKAVDPDPSWASKSDGCIARCC
jgi:choline transporter-like protein 2/4/5